MAPRKKIVSDLLAKHPKAGKQTLAKLLHKQYPQEFTTVEAARTSIRYYTGARGAESRKRAAKADVRPHCTLKIPKGTKQGKTPLRIKTPGKWLVCSDWHVPYHDEVALEACLRFALDSGCEHLYLNGDLIDFYQASQWCKDPRARDLHSELTTLWEVLDMISDRFSEKVYKIGNHEDRFTRRIWQSTPELAVLNRFDVDKVLEVRERGFQVVGSTQHATMHKLNVFHGHELAKGFIAPVNVARGLWLRTNTRALSGHWHRTSTHVETAGVGDHTFTCYSLGCLCDLRPGYAPVNKWNHGFAVVELGQRDYSVTNYVVDRGEVFSAG